MKNTIISIIIAIVLIASAIFFTSGKTEKINGTNNKEVSVEKTEVAKNNVSIVDGVQIIEVQAKGGYSPRKSIAKANTPTILRFNTKGTFDCSSSVRIPTLGISKILPQNGSTDIDLGTNKAGTLQGSCGMGMYPFSIEFQ